MFTSVWRGAAGATLGLGILLCGEAQAPARASLELPLEAIPFGSDAAQRMTVDVRLGERGPYPFVIDTAAERTVISSELAAALDLEAAPGAALQSLGETVPVGMVTIPRLAVSNRVVENIRAPSLARADIGAAGILGVDSLQGQRIVIDFRTRHLLLSPAARRDMGGSEDDVLVRGRDHKGHILIADADIEGQPVRLILDTGSEVSVGNPALAGQLGRHRLSDTRGLELVGVTGGVVPARTLQVAALRIGGVRLRQMSIAVADAQVFRRLAIDDRPAMLLGMDILRNFDRVAVDFTTRRLRFTLPEAAQAAPGDTRLASRG